MNYRKTHQSQAALDNHLARIKRRGGTASVQRMTIYYSFPDKKPKTAKRKLYDTDAKKMAFVKKSGNLVTFKKDFRWNGRDYGQIMVSGFQKQKGSVKIIGFGRDTPWYDSMDDLLKAIDWDLMEQWHASER